MNTLGEISVEEKEFTSSPILGRKNLTLRKLGPSSIYNNLLKSENISITDTKNIDAITISVSLNPQTEVLPIYINLVTNNSVNNSFSIFRDKIIVKGNDVLTMSQAYTDILVNGGKIEISPNDISVSVSFNSYFLVESPEKIVIQFIRDVPVQSTSLILKIDKFSYNLADSVINVVSDYIR